MNVSMSKMGRALSVAALGLGLIGSSGCDAAKEACGLDCPEKGVAEGNASIAGFAAIDGFFNSVVRFKQTAGNVNAALTTELDAIQAGFQLSDADVAAAGSLGAAVKGKLTADFGATQQIQAQPAKCDVDASVTAQATVDCQLEAGCEVEEGKLEVECKGECTAEASAMASCTGEATLECKVTGPSLECAGTCEGSCQLTAAAVCEGSCKGSCVVDSPSVACEGTCEGTCAGTCTGDTDMGAGCKGSCSGMCMGTCKVDLSAGAQCNGMCEGSCEVNAGASCSGKCTGSCTATPPSGSCDAGAKATCKASAMGSVMCSGKCDGEFEPPTAQCDASASCEASAKADAKFSVVCTPPSIDIKWTLNANLDASAQADFDLAINSLQVHLPNLLAALKKGRLVVDAGVELAGDGKAAIEGTVSAVAKGDVDAVAAYRIATCVPGELKVVGNVIADTGKELTASVEAAGSVSTELLGG